MKERELPRTRTLIDRRPDLRRDRGRRHDLSRAGRGLGVSGALSAPHSRQFRPRTKLIGRTRAGGSGPSPAGCCFSGCWDSTYRVVIPATLTSACARGRTSLPLCKAGKADDWPGWPAQLAAEAVRETRSVSAAELSCRAAADSHYAAASSVSGLNRERLAAAGRRASLGLAACRQRRTDTRPNAFTL